MKKPIFIVLIFSLLLNVSCALNETCNQTKSVKLTAGFYHVDHNDTTNVTNRSALIVDSLTLRGLKMDTVSGRYQFVDSILYNNQKKVNSINLPLNNLLNKLIPTDKYATESTFQLKFDAIADTLTIYHKNINDYLSFECGCIVTHSIDTIITTNHYLDSAKIIIRDVNTINAENIRLYSKQTK